MAEGGSYWSMRRRVRRGVAQHLSDIVNARGSCSNTGIEASGDQDLQTESGNSTLIGSDSEVDSDGSSDRADSEISQQSQSSGSEHDDDLPHDIENYFEQRNILSDSDMESDSCNEDIGALSDKLRDWAVNCQIPNSALSELLSILRIYHQDLPKDPRTLLKTKVNYTIIDKCGGQYYYFGIESNLNIQVQHCIESLPEDFVLMLQINIDGLPLFKSTCHQFWPITGKIQNIPNQEPFVIGLYSGTSKPNDLQEYLGDFVDEYLQFQGGVTCFGKHLCIMLDSVVCDTPARSFVKNVKSYSGYHGCDKCIQDGVWMGKMTFPETASAPRTDVAFDEMRDDEHHLGPTPLSQLGIGMVTQIPIDYMHLVCLGVMKRLILLWMKGPLHCRLGNRVVQRISDCLVNLKNSIPVEFARKPRSLYEVNRWKATEFRQFLLYTGPVVLSGLIHPNLYDNFMLLSVSMHILLNESLSSKYSQYAHDLLVAFVTHFLRVYGNDMAVYNVHGLVHLAAEAEKFGSLDNISSFPYENFLSNLKRMVRKPTFPLSQVIRRLSEKNSVKPEKKLLPHLTKSHSLGPLPNELSNSTQFYKVETDQYQLKLNFKDSCVRIAGKVCIIKNIVLQETEIFLVYQAFGSYEDSFHTPLSSRSLGIGKASDLDNTLHFAKLTAVEAKCVAMPFRNKYFVIPFTDAVW